MTISRRGFFGAIFGGAVAAMAAPFLPKPNPMELYRRGALVPFEHDREYLFVSSDATVEEFRLRYIDPAMRKFMDDADAKCFEMIKSS